MIAVSVIIPVYNVEKFIERCAHSLFSQTLENMEFIFVDDCSKDNSIAVIEKVLLEYPNRKEQVTICKQKKNGGPSLARNVGINLAKGEYIAFCDSDDWVELDMYESLYKKAIHTSSDIVFCNFLMEYQDNVQAYKTIDCNKQDKNKLLNDYISSVWTVLWNMIARRTIFTCYQLDLRTDIKYCEDFHLMVRLMYYASKVDKIEDCLYHYNQCNNSSIMQQCHLWSGVDDLKCYLSIIDFFTSQRKIQNFERAMSWRILNAIRLDVFNKEKHATITKIYPVCHRYIFSNPFYSKKEKIYMWLLTHHCRGLLLIIFELRKFLNLMR